MPAARPPRVRQDRRLPARLLPLLSAIAVLLASLGGVWWHSQREPDSLADAALDGPRLAVGNLCVAIAVDVSSSMQEFEDVRRQAVQDLLAFTRRTLEPDDALAMVLHTDQAEILLSLTKVKDLPATAPAERPLGGTTTTLSPAVLLSQQLAATGDCPIQALAAVSDGLWDDDPQALRQTLHQAGLARVRLLMPTTGIRPPGGRPGPTTHQALNPITVEDFHDANDLGLAYGQLLAQLTGQHLGRR